MCARRARARCDRARRQPPRRERCVSDRDLPGDQQQVTKPCTAGHPRWAHRVRNSLGRGVDLVAQGHSPLLRIRFAQGTVGRTPTATSRTASSPALESRFPAIVARNALAGSPEGLKEACGAWSWAWTSWRTCWRAWRFGCEVSGGVNVVACSVVIGSGWGPVGSRLTVPVNRWATSSGPALCRTHARLVFDAGARTPARVGSHDEKLRRQPDSGVESSEHASPVRGRQRAAAHPDPATRTQSHLIASHLCSAFVTSYCAGNAHTRNR
jgi:hypothetical protein